MTDGILSDNKGYEDSNTYSQDSENETVPEGVNGHDEYGLGERSFILENVGDINETIAVIILPQLPTIDQKAALDANNTLNAGNAVASIDELDAVQAGAEPAFDKNTAFNKDFGTTAGTVAEGDEIGSLQTNIDLKEDKANRGVASGYASLDSSGLIPISQLPDSVDEIIEVANFASLPLVGEANKIYITLDNNKTYRWSGTVYVEISASLVIGTTPGTAYDGGSGQANANAISGKAPAFTKNTAFNKDFGTTAGTVYDGASGKANADAIAALPAPPSSWSESDDGIVEKATQVEAEAGTDDEVGMTPLKTAQAIAAQGGGGGETSNLASGTGSLTLPAGTKGWSAVAVAPVQSDICTISGPGALTAYSEATSNSAGPSPSTVGYGPGTVSASQTGGGSDPIIKAVYFT